MVTALCFFDNGTNKLKTKFKFLVAVTNAMRNCCSTVAYLFNIMSFEEIVTSEITCKFYIFENNWKFENFPDFLWWIITDLSFLLILQITFYDLYTHFATLFNWCFLYDCSVFCCVISILMESAKIGKIWTPLLLPYFDLSLCNAKLLIMVSNSGKAYGN